MSDPVRIGIVAEGVTDFIVIRAAIAAILEDRRFEAKPLQPEDSVAFTGGWDAGEFGGGWQGVYQWLRQVVQRGGRLGADIVLDQYDVLILHLDADVADESPFPSIDGLPCSSPCPPAAVTCQALRAFLFQWAGETDAPPGVATCIPSKSTEARVVAALFPDDARWRRLGECLPNPASRLGQQPIRQRISQRAFDYQEKAGEIGAAWPHLVRDLSQARAFQDDFARAVLDADRAAL